MGPADLGGCGSFGCFSAFAFNSDRPSNHHLDGNIIRKLAGRLGALLQPFREAFWGVYYAFSPEALNWLGSNSYSTIPRQLRISSLNYGHAVIDGHLPTSPAASPVVLLIELVNNLIKRTKDQDDLEKLRLREGSVFYEATPVSLPAGATTWVADEVERVVIAAEGVLNSFTDDSIHISAPFMLRLIEERGWVCTHLFKISHYASATVHFIAVLDNGHIIYDCMMGTDLGMPCRHFYALLGPASDFPLRSFNARASPPPITQTLPPKVIHHQAMTKFKDVLRHVPTEADLSTLKDNSEQSEQWPHLCYYSD
ncbi:hypothetical protein B0H14DRAFT_2563374 [Mycena olivaceomarginata]|nr:hypothetical protein B0H14DRAFT_2563374 [Mycena olivaceomarginata]